MEFFGSILRYRIKFLILFSSFHNLCNDQYWMSCLEKLMNIGNPAFLHEELKDLVPAADGGVVQRGLAVVVRHIHLQEKNGTTTHVWNVTSSN
jgi:hypothetical protein